MKLRFLFLIAFLLHAVGAWPLSFVTPEQFGAYGDGVTDDSPAFGACIRSGLPIRLKDRALYALHSQLPRISGSSFELQGRGATVIIDNDYPVEEYDEIFAFDDEGIHREKYCVSNLKIECRLGEKFPDFYHTGDTYLLCSRNCKKTIIQRVDFIDKGWHNNVSFLVVTGGDLYMSDCDIVSHSASRMGGAVWVMDKCSDHVSVFMKRVTIDYDTLDECFCLAVDALSSLPTVGLDAEIDDCSFSGAGTVPSSGLFIIHTDTANTIPNFNIHVRRSKFFSKGIWTHRIVMYQCPPVPEALYSCTFQKCLFDFAPQKFSDVGLIALIQQDRGIAADHIRSTFRNCDFRIRNICSIIGDKDGPVNGSLYFYNCRISTDGELFSRKYNAGVGDIRILTRGGKMKYRGENPSTEQLNTKNTLFSRFLR